MLKRRQDLGSTGIGRGVAIVYLRSLAVRECHVGFGRSRDGIEFKAIDDKPVHYFFLIVAPPLEESNQFLPVLGKIAKLAREADFLDRLRHLERPGEFLQLLEERLT
jgi:mannitol/fructose-specific phosphotransferase system IIA component (Ntr-type)